jgi:three-Cys-motif partner protein
LVRFFKGWAAVLEPHAQRLLYIDLFAGPGTYECDEHGRVGTPDAPIHSTAVLIVDAAARNPRFAKALVSVFNDGNAEFILRLKVAIDALPARANLKYDPQYFSGLVDDQVAKLFGSLHLPPAMLFIDPFGYSGLTRALIASVLKDWGSDCVFFLNYNRINQAFGRHGFDMHLNALFGEERVDQIREYFATNIGSITATGREDYIIDRLYSALSEIGGSYSISYRFRGDSGRTMQHVVFTSKNLRGYLVMKDAMASQSTETADGVPTYEFVEPAGMPGLFEEVLPPREFPFSVAKLADQLKERYGKLTREFDQIYREHNIGLPYIEKNYRAAVLMLWKRGAVELRRPDGSLPRANSCPRDTLVTFKS